jgi:hypothetical protein
MKTFLLKYVARPAYYLNEKAWAPALIPVPVMLALLLTYVCAGGLNKNTVILFVLFVVPLSAWLFIWAGVGAHIYEKSAVPAQTLKYVKEAGLVKSIIEKYGPLPLDGVRYFVNTEKNNYTRARLQYAVEECKDLAINNSSIVSLCTQRGVKPDVEYGLSPQDGDYVAGYYQMLSRLRVIRENPELASVPLDMLDTLYDTKDLTSSS